MSNRKLNKWMVTDAAALAYKDGKADGILNDSFKNAYDQVRWERDIAIEQLKELGYEFGEKVCYKPSEVNEEKIRKDGIWQWTCGKCGRFHSNEYPLKHCNECGAKVDWSEWE